MGRAATPTLTPSPSPPGMGGADTRSCGTPPAHHLSQDSKGPVRLVLPMAVDMCDVWGGGGGWGTGAVALELPDVQKLKRNVALLCDRLGKGGRLTSSGAPPTTATPTTATVALATQSLERKSSMHTSKSQLGKLPPLPESSTEEQEDNQISEL